MASTRKITLRSSDGEAFSVDEAVAMESQTIKHMIENGCADSGFSVHLTSKILAKVIEYWKTHVDVNSDAKVSEDLKTWDSDFVKVDPPTLFDLVLAANYLNIESLLDLTCQTVADMIKGKTPEDVRKTFNIKNDVTPEEEEEVRRKMVTDIQPNRKMVTDIQPNLFEILTLDLVVKILSRLPVKSLVQLRRVCKSWNFLISDPKFAKMHLDLSRSQLNCQHLLYFNDITGPSAIGDTQLSSFFNSPSFTFISGTNLRFPATKGVLVGSCDGILLFRHKSSAMVWNPSIRKFKILAPLPDLRKLRKESYGIGYDSGSATYKVVVIRLIRNHRRAFKFQVMLHSLGNEDTWKTVEGFPSNVQGNIGVGKFVSDAINWYEEQKNIISFDLRSKSFKVFSPPDCEKPHHLCLDVLRDSLCIIAYTHHSSLVRFWFMRDFGNQDSWTKLFTVSCFDFHCQMHPEYPLYISENDKFLFGCGMQLVVYNLDGTRKKHQLQEFKGRGHVCGYKHVYVESLIAP